MASLLFSELASTLTYYTGYDFTTTTTSSSSSSVPSSSLSTSSVAPSSVSSSPSTAVRGTADFSSLSADPSTLSSDPLDWDEENATSLYGGPSLDGDEFFNLGESSFPLLPHAPYMVDPFDDAEGEGGEHEGGQQEREQKRSLATSSRSSHHFSSVLNNPSSSFYDFEEEDVLPYSPAYIGALADTNIDTSKVRAYVEHVAGEVDVYAENHPGALMTSMMGTPGEKSNASSSTSRPLSSPTASNPHSLLSPFTSLPSAFTFARRRTGSSQSSSLSRSRRLSSHPTPEQLAQKAAQEEEAMIQRELAECMASVPTPFFSPSFDLMLQPFFVDHLHSISFPASSAVSIQNHTRQSIALQSSLSSHLDQVELNLFRQINARSHLFFTQMTAVERLKAEIEESLGVIDGIREAVHYVDENLVHAGLEVSHLHVHRRNVTTLMQRLEAMAQCQKTQQTVQLLLSTGDYSSSLMLIQHTRAVLNAELHGVAAMKNVERKLMEQVKLIEKLMEREMMEIITQAEEEGGEREEERKSSFRKNGDERERRRGEVQVIRRDLTEEERDRMSPILENLIKLHSLSHTLQTYKKELIECIQQRLTALVYKHIDAVVNEDLEEETTQAQQPSITSTAASPPTATPSTTAISSTPSTTSANPPTLVRAPFAPSQASNDANATSTAVSLSPPPSSSSPGASTVSAPTPAPAPVAAAVGSRSPSPPAAAPSQSPNAPADAKAQRSPSPMPDLPPPSQSSSSSSVDHPTDGVPPSSTATSPATPIALATAVVPSPAPAAPTPTITTRLQSLSHRQFLDFLSPLFAALMDPIYRAASVRSLLSSTIESIERELDVTAALSSSTPDARLLSTLASKKADYQSNVAAFNELLSSASEYLHLRMAKLLHTRAALHAVLSLTDFRELLDVVLSFLLQSEGMCGKQFYGMRGALLGQAKGFVSHFHSQSMKDLAEGLEKEKWTRVDVDVEYQELLDQGFVPKQPTEDRGGKDTTEGRKKEEKEREEKAPGDSNRKRNGAVQGGDEEKKEERAGSSSVVPSSSARKVLFVPIPRSSATSSSPMASTPSSSSSAFSFPSSSSASSSSNFLKFPVVRSVLLLLRLISHYVELSSHLPALTLDTLHRLLDLLTLFNSRTCQLVLGAGAMHLAGLKSITATHLALSSQAIALLASQIPRLRLLFEQRLQAKHRLFLQGFDRVKKDCEEHVEQIREKLTAIMRDLIEQSLKRMTLHITQQIPSLSSPTSKRDEEEEEDEDDVVSPATRTLMKQTCSLHRALTDLLSGRERNLIFREIGGALVGGFMVACRKLEGEGGVGATNAHSERLRMLLQANGLHILMRMRTLTGVDEEVVVQLKEFIERLRGEPTQTPARSSPLP